MDLITFLHTTLESGFALFCIFAAIYVRIYKRYAPTVNGVLTGVFLISALINIADAFAYFYRGDISETGYVMVRLSNFIVFVGMFLLLGISNLLLDTVLAARNAGSDKRMRNAVYIICGAAIVAVIVLSLTGTLYYFDESNRYHRGGAYFVVPLLAVAAIICGLIRVIRERASLRKSEYRAILCCWLLPLAGAAAQPFFYGISLSALANSVAVLILFIVYIRAAVADMSVRRSFILNGESIENTSEEIDRFLANIDTERQNRIRIRFTVEDALIRIWEKFGDMDMVRVTAGITFGKPSIKIEHEGSSFNPFTKTGETEEDWSSGMLASAGLRPSYSYSHGTNVIRLNLGRLHINPVVTVMIAIVFGLVTGSVATMTLAPADVQFVTQGLMMPVYDLWNNILYSVSAPAMFILVMSTMLDTREISEQGGNAGRIMGRYFMVMLITGLVTVGSAVAVAHDSFMPETITKETVADLIRKFFSIVPENLLDPFKDFNTAQLILMGMVIAYAIMAVGQDVKGVASLINQLNMICMQLAQWISGLMPLFTIFLTAQLMLEHNAGALILVVRMLPFSIVVSLICMVMIILYISGAMHVSPRLLVKKMMPTFLLTLRTGQVADSYALAEKCCQRDLGIQKIFTQRLLPMGLVLYMPVSMVGMMSFVIFAAIQSGTPLTPVWVLMALVFSLILLVAAPPIPGINLLSYVVIISQLGIGKEYVIAAMIFDIVFNMFASAANQMLLQADLVLQADRVGLLNHKSLNKEL